MSKEALEQGLEQVAAQQEAMQQYLLQPPLKLLLQKLREALHGGQLGPPIVHPRHISHKPAGRGNEKITYMTHHHRKGYMDLLVGRWDWRLDPPVIGGERLYLVGHLTIHGCDGSLTRSATGTETLKTSSYGDPSSNAEAMAFGRACMAFGFVREWWDKDKA